MFILYALSLNAEHSEEYIVCSISLSPSALSLAVCANSSSVLFYHSFKNLGYSSKRLRKKLALSSTLAVIGCLNAIAIV